MFALQQLIHFHASYYSFKCSIFLQSCRTIVCQLGQHFNCSLLCSVQVQCHCPCTLCGLYNRVKVRRKKLCITVLLGNCLSAAAAAAEGHLHCCLIDTFYGYESTDCRLSACLAAWLRGCLMTSNDCTRDRIAIKYRIFGFRVWRSKQRIEQTIECIHQILLLCLPPLKRSTDLNDRNVHEISICSNVIFEHNLSIDEGGNPSKSEREG